MSDEAFDLVVVGGGSGGVRAARVAAGLGARVALCEARDPGGTCVHRGCVPKKLLLAVARAGGYVAEAAALGWPVPSLEGAVVAWPRIRDAVRRETDRLGGLYARVLQEAGVTVLRGRATLQSPHEVDVAGRCLRARHVLLATGSRPKLPTIPGGHLGIDSDRFFLLPALPESVLVVGAGYVGTELASLLAGLGVRTTLLFRHAHPLPGFDERCRAFLGERLATRLRLVPERTVERIERHGDGSLLAHTDCGETLCADLLLCAIGRVPNTTGLGLEAVGVRLDARGFVRVDEQGRSSVPSVYAVGDLTPGPMLTPVAIREGERVARHLFGGRASSSSLEPVPTTVFTTPELATVGLAEREAAERYPAASVFEADFRPLRHALTGRDDRALVKVVVEGEAGRVLGVHIVAEQAGEMLQGFAAALRAGLTKAQLDATVGIHPTEAEELTTLRTPVRRYVQGRLLPPS